MGALSTSNSWRTRRFSFLLLSRKSVILWTLLLPFSSVIMGVLVMYQHGVSTLLWTQNLGACVGATLLCLGFSFTTVRLPLLRLLPRRQTVMLVLLLGLLSTFCFPGLQGVHRWVSVWSLKVNVAEAVLPLFLIILLTERRVRSANVWLWSIFGGSLLYFQPDACQATAFLVSVGLFLILETSERHATSWIVGLALFSLAWASWMRHDPLDRTFSVPYVEGILGLAADSGFIWSFLAAGFLLLLPVPFVAFYFCKRRNGSAPTALALGVYFALSLLGCLSGRFPVLLMGYGISPFLGYYIAMGWLIAQEDFSASRKSETDLQNGGVA